MFSGLGLIFYDGTEVLKVLRKKMLNLARVVSMACGTCAREQELQRAILTTPHKIGYLIIGIKNMSTF
jgi:hypothetical protein